MYGIAVRTPDLLALCLAEEGNIIARRNVCVNVLQPYVHRSNFYAELRETRKEVEEMVRRQRKFRWLYTSRSKVQIRQRQRGGQCRRCGGGRIGGDWGDNAAR